LNKVTSTLHARDLIINHTWSNTIEKITNIFLVIVCYLLLHCDMISAILYYAIVDIEPRNKVKIMPPIPYSIMTIIKYSNLLIHECNQKLPATHQRRLGNSYQWEAMLSKASTGRRLFTLCCMFIYRGELSYNMIVPSKGSIIIKNTTIRPLSFPGYFLQSVEQSCLEIVFL